MYLTFMDESGDISFSNQSQSKYFSITCLTIDEAIKNKLKNTIKKKRAKLYKLGWPKKTEIKANILHGLNRNRRLRKKLNVSIEGDEFIKEILTSVKNSCHPRIDCITINKDKIKDESFRNAEYGIAYNYFAGKLLCPLIMELQNCELTVDRRSKETHPKKHFNDYLKTQVIGEAFERSIKTTLNIHHLESHKNLGLQVVDFFSWGLYRHIAYRDSQFYDIFKELICGFQRWYC